MRALIKLTDGSGRSFDPDKAITWKEDQLFEGDQHVSVATGVADEHERLHQAHGRWIIESWRDGEIEPWSVRVVPETIAHEWLEKNGHAIPA